MHVPDLIATIDYEISRIKAVRNLLDGTTAIERGKRRVRETRRLATRQLSAEARAREGRQAMNEDALVAPQRCSRLSPSNGQKRRTFGQSYLGWDKELCTALTFYLPQNTPTWID